MGLLQAYKMAIKSIVGNKARAFLTMLGVIIGVAAVISAVAFAQGSTKSITDKIKELGTNTININITERGGNRTVSYADLQKYAEANSDTVAHLVPKVTYSNVTTKAGTISGNTTVLGTNPDYEEVNSAHIQSGRFLLSYDVDYRLKTAIIGTAVAKELFPGKDPLNQKMKINGEPFEIVGVLQETDGSSDGSADDTVIIPVTVAQRMAKQSIIRNFVVQTVRPDDVSKVMDSIKAFLLSIFEDDTAYRVSNSEQSLEVLDTVTSSMMMILGGIAAVSLIVGGIGIMNIMLVSVTERTREIGIRKAIGAQKKNILIQFLIEALMVTGIGGLTGVLLGLSVIHFIIGGFKIVPEAYSVPWTLLAFGISLGVGVIFGMFPAYKAANLNPIEALRYE